MSFFAKLFGKKNAEEQKIGGMEDYMTLIRVYFQSVLAIRLGITNLAALPDLRIFKSSLRIATANNKLGVAEKARCKKMMKELYKADDDFFDEIDASIKKNCKNQNDIRGYMIAFQGFSQEVIMLVSNRLSLKVRIPGFLSGILKKAINNEVHTILNGSIWNDDATRHAAADIKVYQRKLGFSEQWIQDYVYNIIVLAKKEPKPSDEDIQKAEKKLKK